MLGANAAAYTPGLIDLPDWRTGSSSFDAPPNVRRRHLRVVESTSADQGATLYAADEQSIKAVQRAIKNQRVMRATAGRITALLTDACAEGDPHSLESATQLFSFLGELLITERPAIFLLDNGNFQLVLRNSEREQISLQFFGNGVVQFAMFALRQGLPMARIAGQDSADEVRAKIIEHGCQHLIV